ncbi:MAG: DMT family transporter [Vicinamibacterales bacterium]
MTGTTRLLTPLDALLVLVVVSWGANLSLIKVVLRELPAGTFNALRLLVAAALFAVVIARTPAGQRRHIATADWPRVAALGVFGGTLYQVLFLAAVPRTSVANTGLIFGMAPVVISLLSAAVGHERFGWTRWLGGALSVVGLYFVVGVGATLSVNSLAGDLLALASVLCWAGYSVASRPLLGRYSPTVLTAWTQIVGTCLYLPLTVPDLRATQWEGVSALGWGLTVVSAVFCLVAAYVIWYTGVQRLGATRTSAYSNLTPIAAMLIGWLWVGEPLTAAQGIGAAAILAGVFVTRLSPVVLSPLRSA